MTDPSIPDIHLAPIDTNSHVIDRAFQDRVHHTNQAKGFHSDPAVQHPAIKIALMHSELSELVEHLRDETHDAPSRKVPEITNEEEELADEVIRCLDYAGARGLDLVRAVVLKQAYNESRAWLHGKAF